MSAAEEPRPVLATSGSATPVGLKGGICASEASETGRLRLLSWTGGGGIVRDRVCFRLATSAAGWIGWRGVRCDGTYLVLL
jgi:hypothetical protein